MVKMNKRDGSRYLVITVPLYYCVSRYAWSSSIWPCTWGSISYFLTLNVLLKLHAHFFSPDFFHLSTIINIATIIRLNQERKEKRTNLQNCCWIECFAYLQAHWTQSCTYYSKRNTPLIGFTCVVTNADVRIALVLFEPLCGRV